MWDVIWTDPDKELVGEHRAKKERAREDKEKTSIRSGRDSAATSASNSSSEAPFNFFRSRGAKNAVAPKSKESHRTPSFSRLATPSLTSTLSPFSQTFDSSSRRSSGLVTTAPTSPNKDGPETLHSDSERDTVPSFDECLSQSFGSIDSSSQIRSPLSEAATTESPNIATLIQLLGDLPPRLELPEIPRSTPSTTEMTDRRTVTEKMTPSPGTLAVTSPRLPSQQQEEATIPEVLGLLESPGILTPPPKSSRRPTPAPLGINNTSAWRTPSQWRDHDARKANRALDRVKKRDTKEGDIKTETFALSPKTEGVYSVSGAPTAMILARVKQVLTAESVNEPNQSGENSKQYWMLSLLHGLGYITDPSTEDKYATTPAPPTGLVMLLYETTVYAEYLGTLHADTQVYHLSKESFTTSSLRNIQTLQAPLLETACFPVSPRLFETVYSFNLPSRVPYQVLPNILRSISQCLKLGGTFKLTMIDPLPRAETLGYKLRNWMERHLFPNLEKSSRCLEPSRLFPKLLGDAGLRGKGSRRTKVKFFALQDNARGGDYNDPDPSIARQYREQQDKAELRTLIGRLFWIEVWGQHVTPPYMWWWDDPECIAECRELGTFWEYQIIDAVKAE